eukprot:TRINITY_DN32286_c0_g1_i1.p1 TRINITY_DN32286_c0_g1~~TRINITY_DN32286_c0_g1_i1.p1  ORF type:complete len:183 (+),score=24.70 TRINITY_DN32286_c0_g1_i1:38-550(+)
MCYAHCHNDLQLRYYKHHLTKQFGSTALWNLVGEIAAFASDGYRVGMYLDVQDYQPRWCVTRVIALAPDCSWAKVHFCGWPERFDTNLPNRFYCYIPAPAFTESTACWRDWSPGKLRTDTRQTMEDKVAWIVLEGFTLQEAKDTLQRFSNDQFTAINYLMYKQYHGPFWR